jgi:copper(I)-binding protein
MLRLSFHRFALASLILIATAIPAIAENAITVEKAWSRATPVGSEVAAGYLTIVNHGDAPDRLVSVSTAVAGKTEIHQMKMSDGKMEMRPVPEGIVIPAKGTVVLKPMGYHLMLMGLKAPLQKGATFTGDLVFEHAGDVTVTFDVEGMGAMGPSAE